MLSGWMQNGPAMTLNRNALTIHTAAAGSVKKYLCRFTLIPRGKGACYRLPGRSLPRKRAAGRWARPLGAAPVNTRNIPQFLTTAARLLGRIARPPRVPLAV